MTTPENPGALAEGQHAITQVEDSPSLYGHCAHTDAPKYLLAQGEHREPVKKTVEPEPGIFVEVVYYRPDEPVVYRKIVICGECGMH